MRAMLCTPALALCAAWLACGLACGLAWPGWAREGEATVVAQPGASGLVDTRSDTWVATDGLGRTLAGEAECRARRDDRAVGIFYFLWLTSDANGGGVPSSGPFDIARIVAANPTNPEWGPVNAFHHWSEPLFGYYLMDDEWVIRRHAQMLTDAGVDVIIFDATNMATYPGVYLRICAVYQAMRAEGRATPQIAFLLNTEPVRTARKLWDEFYGKGLYPELWFPWKGKPLLMASPEGMPDPLRDFFTFRHSWAWCDPNGWFGTGRDKWPWLASTPQGFGWHESPDRPEQISVAVAEHPVSNIGRSFHDGAEPAPADQRPEAGLHFAEQIRRALEVDPEFVFITGWNEWVAQRFVSDGGMQLCGRPLAKGDTFFVDTYSQEYSRDIEPMRGGHGDAYYWQMVDFIRRYKGVRPLPSPSAPKTIAIDGDFGDWDEVAPEYRDDAFDTVARNHPGWGSVGTLIDTTGRNDIVLTKVARDTDSLYVYVRTREALSPPTDRAWMMLFLGSGDYDAGWEGFQFVVNRTVVGRSATLLERSTGGFRFEPVAELRFEARGNEMELAIPRAALGWGPDRGPLDFRLKWIDNMQAEGDPLDSLVHGEAAPNGRFAYRYREQ
jgi:hypothetical protein